MSFLLRFILSTIAVIFTTAILSGISIPDFWTAVLVAMVLGIINTFIKPILILLTLPINIITLGLFTLVLNGLLVMLTSSLVSGFYVANFWWAVAFSVVLSLATSFLSLMANPNHQ